MWLNFRARLRDHALQRHGRNFRRFTRILPTVGALEGDLFVDHDQPLAQCLCDSPEIVLGQEDPRASAEEPARRETSCGIQSRAFVGESQRFLR